MIEHDALLRLLHYEPSTGVFTWLERRGGRAIGDRAGCVWRGYRKVSYRHIQVNGKSYPAHRLAWFWVTGGWPPKQIDHIDGDGLNNRWDNLRPATNSQNQANTRLSSRSRTGFKGVRFHKGRYSAEIKVSGKKIYLGCFGGPEEAHAAYRRAAIKYFGEFAKAA